MNTIEPTICSLFLETVEKYADKIAISYKKGDIFEEMPYKRLKNLVGNFVLTFEHFGVKKGDRIILLSENRPEWIIVDLANLFIGAITVPIHKILSSIQIMQIIDEIEPRLIIVSDREALEKILEIESVKSKKIDVIFLESILEKEKELIKKFKGQHFINSLQLIGHYHTGTELEEKAKQIKPEDDASIIYTSGTTGHPKGAILTHKNFVSNALTLVETVGVFPEDRFLSVLPLSHVFERTTGYYVPLFSGSSISYIEDVTRVSEFAKEEKPTIIIAVPRLYEKIYEKIYEKVSESAFKKALFLKAVEYGKVKENRSKFLYKLYDLLVFKKIKDNFGGDVRFFVSGGASLAKWLGEFFDSIGTPVLEGYGLTETAPVIACNCLDNYRFGTVGQVLKGLSVKLSADNEILVKGPSVMRGYFKDEESTRKDLSANGWFKTGDLGKLDEEGFLSIIGRKKEVLVLTTGKKIFPVVVEEACEKHPYVSQCLVFGDGYKHIGAIIVPTEIAEKELGEKIEEGIGKILNEQLKEFSKIEQIKKFIISPEPFTVENGLLTITLKLRRNQILEKFEDKVEYIYKIK
ncbi:AMP-dependent synthetase [bacterium (Candidatus Howlettbacteria) CG23_combo_of_CG06-09_8_20_14_all_37_9]|nr:MAG: AMP-dependent synthetase [bacterium (Candidatus Howlettbacteria) CG23_combo_of_CG06-09_8_20_14_all_37_9]